MLERPTHSEQPSIQLALEWGTDQSGTFLNAVLNITNNGTAPLQIRNDRAVVLDVYVSGTNALTGRFTAWIEPGIALQPIASGASSVVELSAASATAACKPPTAQHLPPGAFDAVLDLETP